MQTPDHLNVQLSSVYGFKVSRFQGSTRIVSMCVRCVSKPSDSRVTQPPLTFSPESLEPSDHHITNDRLGYSPVAETLLRDSRRFLKIDSTVLNIDSYVLNIDPLSVLDSDLLKHCCQRHTSSPPKSRSVAGPIESHFTSPRNSFASSSPSLKGLWPGKCVHLHSALRTSL